MVEISFLSAELIFTAIWLLARIIVWKQQGQIQVSLSVMQSMLHSYVLIAKYRFIRIVHVHGKTLGVFFSCVTLL
jgi:hypothetical protein